MMCKNKCGTCCKFLFFAYLPDVLDAGTKELLKMRGAILFKNCYALPSKCKYLDKDNLCTIYLDRPKVCKLFDCRKFVYKGELADIRKKCL